MKKLFLLLATFAVLSCGSKSGSSNSTSDSTATESELIEDSTMESTFGSLKKTDFDLFKIGMTRQEVDAAIEKIRGLNGPSVVVNDLEFVINWDCTEFTEDGKLTKITFEATAPEVLYKGERESDSFVEGNLNSKEMICEQVKYVGLCMMKTIGGKEEENNYNDEFKFISGNTLCKVEWGIGDQIEGNHIVPGDDLMNEDKSFDVYSIIYTVMIQKK